MRFDKKIYENNLPLYDKKVPKKHILDPQIRLEPSENIFIPTSSKNWPIRLTIIHLIIWSYMTKKSKMHILDPKCAFLDPKIKSEPFENIFILTGSKKWHMGPTIIHLPTLTLDIFALIWPKSLKKIHFGPKMSFILPKMSFF